MSAERACVSRVVPTTTLRLNTVRSLRPCPAAADHGVGGALGTAGRVAVAVTATKAGTSKCGDAGRRPALAATLDGLLHEQTFLNLSPPDLLAAARVRKLWQREVAVCRNG